MFHNLDGSTIIIGNILNSSLSFLRIFPWHLANSIYYPINNFQVSILVNNTFQISINILKL